MSEVLSKIITYGFEEMNLRRMDAYTNKNNIKSLKLLEGTNFIRNHAFEKIYEDKEELEYNVIYTREKT